MTVATPAVTGSLEPVTPSLYRTPAEHPFGDRVQTLAYLLRRPDGNILIYSSDTLIDREPELRELGGIRLQYLNHRDEASASCDWVWDTFRAPLICHQREREAAQQRCQVHDTFDREVQLHPNLRAIPTPGHCPGSTCYLWEHEGRRYLFTGDTLYLSGGELAVYVNLGTDAEMIDSLRRIAALEVDVLLPGLYIGEVSRLEIPAAELGRRIQRLIDSLEERAGR